MSNEEFEELTGLDAPLNDEDYAQFGLEEFSQEQIDQGNFFIPEGFCPEEQPFVEPDTQDSNDVDGSV